MAKKMYIGVSNIARKVASAYIGVSNVARRVIKGYIGDANGVAQLFFQTQADEELTFTSSQTWTVPSGAQSIDIFCVGGGGGAGGSFKVVSGSLDYNSYYRTTVVYAPSGGSGYTATALNVAVTPGEELTIAVGSGGSGGMTYADIQGSQRGDVSSISSMTNGGDGGESYVARGATKLATANGGKGGAKANITSSGAGYYNGTTGANGGNASGAGGADMENMHINGQGAADSDIAYFYGRHSDEGSTARGTLYGTNGTNGGNGGSVDYWYVNILTSAYSRITANAFSGGTGQGSNTRKYGDPSGTVYATVATAVSANTGNSGALGLTAYTNKAGSSGVVIIMVHY